MTGAKYPIEILMEHEGCTKDAVEELAPLIRRCELKTIVSHNGVMVLSRDMKEYSVDHMRRLDDPHPDGTQGYGILQPNTIYIYCEYDEGTATTREYNRSEILAHLRIKTPRFVPITVTIPLSHRYQKEYIELPGNIQKDITFINDADRSEMGFYNLKVNLLWLSDITHLAQKFVPLMKDILTKIHEVRTSGRIFSKSLLVGADPEFEIIDKRGRLIGANVFFHGGKEIGTDGHLETGEIRPDPGRSPYHLMRNIKRVMRKLLNSESIPPESLIFAGGGTKVNTGGHIHFSEKSYPKELPHLLHKHIGIYVLKHQTGIRNDLTDIIREGGRDAFRPNKPHGGWEWRQLPSYIVSEDMCQCIIVTTYALTKAVYDGAYKDGETIHTLKSLPLYYAYKKDIDMFIEMFVTNKGKVKLEGVDIAPNWRIAKKRRSSITIISRNADIKKYFTPVPCRLRHNISVQIEYSGNSLVSFGISRKAIEQLDRVARLHYIEHLNYKTVDDLLKYSQDYQYLTQRRGQAPYPDVVILFPTIWAQGAKKNERLYRRIGWILQASIQETEGI